MVRHQECVQDTEILEQGRCGYINIWFLRMQWVYMTISTHITQNHFVKWGKLQAIGS